MEAHSLFMASDISWGLQFIKIIYTYRSFILPIFSSLLLPTPADKYSGTFALNNLDYGLRALGLRTW